MPITALNVVSKMRSRAFGKFAELPNLQTLIDVLAAPLQEIEDGIATLLAVTIDNATGVFLERYGKVFSLPKLDAWTDTEYRRRIKIRILAYASRGRADDLIAVARALRPTGVTEEVDYSPGFPAGYTMMIPDIPTADRDAAMEDMSIATAHGVQGNIIFWMTGNPPATYGRSPGTTYGYGNGVYVQSRQTQRK